MTPALTVHRGSRQIGGSCLEVRCGAGRLILDAGLPLDWEGQGPPRADPRQPPPPGLLPPAPGLYLGDEAPAPDAVLFSHAHPDHSGLLPWIKPGIPLGVSAGTRALLEAYQAFLPGGPRLAEREIIALEDGRPLDLGGARVTPFLVDHSGFDARAVQIECGGRTILYSGDLRGHGRKARALESLLRRARPAPDALVLEGTTLGREARPDAPASEEEVEARLTGLIGGEEGLVLAAFSSQDLDRLVSLFKAARRNRRVLAVDVYAAIILQALAAWPGLPQPGWRGLRVWYPQRVCRWLERLGLASRLEALRVHGVSSRAIAADPGRYVLAFRDSMQDDLPRLSAGAAPLLIYAMWSGYLERPGWRAVLAALGEERLRQVHVSGHADLATLERIVASLRPRRLIPVHTQRPELFQAIWPQVELLEDGRELPL